MQTFLQQLSHISTLVFDVDGVLTNGDVFVADDGNQFRQFNIKDGYALQLAVKCGYHVCAISGAEAKATHIRLNRLGITHVYTGCKDKSGQLEQYLEKIGVMPANVLFMGDDIPDLQVMQLAGLPVCPADAVAEIKAISKYISPVNGGEGCVRDVIEKVMRVQGKWLSGDAYSW